MQAALILTLTFSAALVASLIVKFWLASRQMRHVAAHRAEVPPVFAHTITLPAHQRAADYTLAKGRLGLLVAAFGAAVLLGWTLLGGIDALNALVRDAVQPRFGSMAYQLALLAAFAVIGGALDLPFELYSTFRVEQRFGFNRMTWKLYVADLLKGALVGALIGLPVAALMLWIMGATGGLWWLWAWGAWMVFNLLILVLYPTLIAPLFNKFEPLADESLKARVQALMARCGFAAKGLFVMDGSKRSAHANAYFTGFGAAKRVVFFDTLLSKLSPGEVEAVLAHELGHFKLRHVAKRVLWSALLSLGILALLAWLAQAPWFYAGLGIPQAMLDVAMSRPGVALELFLLALPVFTFVLEPLSSLYSRRHEFEADAFATRHASAAALTVALVKLYEDNAATLTPDPLHSAFYDSHPPAAARIARIEALSDRPPLPLAA
jgi:STE24 endopeptidase